MDKFTASFIKINLIILPMFPKTFFFNLGVIIHFPIVKDHIVFLNQKISQCLDPVVNKNQLLTTPTNNYLIGAILHIGRIRNIPHHRIIKAGNVDVHNASVESALHFDSIIQFHSEFVVAAYIQRRQQRQSLEEVGETGGRSGVTINHNPAILRRSDCHHI